MSAYTLQNFTLTDTTFRYSDVAETKWLNTDRVTDLKMQLSETTFAGYGDKEQKQIDSTWNSLLDRAKADLPTGSAFAFYNSEILLWDGIQTKDNTVSVANGLCYQDVTAVRSQQELFDAIAVKPSAFVLMNILVTADNKIVLGRREYYGDWPHDTYECAGSFLKEKDIPAQSLIEIAKQKVRDDYVGVDNIVSAPFMIMDLPRVMETMLLCVSSTSLIAAQMHSVFYTDILILDNSMEGRRELQSMDIELFHPPSRVALEVYFDMFPLTQQLLEQAT